MRREQTRELILQAAREALIRTGYERITTRRIAEEAGVNIATLHYYFGTKEALLSEAVHYAIQQTYTRLQQSIDAAPDAVTALGDTFQTVWNIVRERPGILRFDLVVRALRDESAREEVLQLYEGFRRILFAIFKRREQEGISWSATMNPEHLAHFVVASVDGIVLHHAVTGDDEAARVSLTLLLQYTLSQLGVENPEGFTIEK